MRSPLSSLPDSRRYETLSTDMNEPKRASVSALAALASVVAMVSCCLPLPAILLAGGLSIGGVWLTEARPYLLALSLALVGYALYSLYRKRSCAMARPLWAQALVWLSLGAVVALGAFPQWSANRLAGSASPSAVKGGVSALPLRTLIDLNQLRTSFNASINETRVIALLSPT